MFRKILIAIAATAMLASASAASFTLFAGASDVALVPTASADLFGAGEFAFSITPGLDWVLGVTADDLGGAVLTGLSVDLPRSAETDATAYLATRVGVGTSWDFSAFSPVGTLTLGVRGDNGLVFEGGVLLRTDFGFSAFSLSPVVLFGYGFGF